MNSFQKNFKIKQNTRKGIKVFSTDIFHCKIIQYKCYEASGKQFPLNSFLKIYTRISVPRGFCAGKGFYKKKFSVKKKEGRKKGKNCTVKLIHRYSVKKQLSIKNVVVQMHPVNKVFAKYVEDLKNVDIYKRIL